MPTLKKMNKYQHFITDITTKGCVCSSFEIGSRGYISPSNKANLKKLHKFCKFQTIVPKSIKTGSAVIIPHF